MSGYYYGPQPHQSSASSSHSSSSHNHHGGRSRRAPRLSASQNSHRQFRGVKSMKELTENPSALAARARFEAGRGFELDDDLEFCPGLLTEDDLQSIHSSSTDGSLSSGSPHSSPLQSQSEPQSEPQPQQLVTPTYSVSSAASNNTYGPISGFHSSNNHNHHQAMKIHQPSALRTRNAIPIVNPHTGMRLPSPPSSVSPAMLQQQAYHGRWQV